MTFFISFSLARIFFYFTRPTPNNKFSNGPSLTRNKARIRPHDPASVSNPALCLLACVAGVERGRGLGGREKERGVGKMG